MKTAITELIEWMEEIDVPIGIIKQTKKMLEQEKAQLCDFYIRGRNEQHLDYYPEKHAKEEYDLVFNKKEDGKD